MQTTFNKTKTRVNRVFLLAATSAVMISSGILAPLSAAQAADKTTIKVGIISGKEKDVWREVVKQAAAKGLTVKPVVFNDYNQPNEALQNSEVDANAPWLKTLVAAYQNDDVKKVFDKVYNGKAPASRPIKDVKHDDYL